MIHRPALTFLCLIFSSLISVPAAAQDVPDEADYAPLWSFEGGTWTGSLHIIDARTLWSVSSSTVYEHDLTAGTSREVSKLCSGIMASKVAEGALINICFREVEVVRVDGGAAKRSTALSLPGISSAAAFGDETVAVAFDDLKLRVYGLDRLEKRREFTLPSEVETIAMRPDGSELLAVLKAGGLWRFDVAKGRGEVVELGSFEATKVLAISPEGQVFLDGSGFKAAIYDLDTAAITHRYKVGSWITSAVFLSPGAVLATGSDGHVIFDLSRSRGVALQTKDRSGAGVAASPDGAVVCLGSRAGAIDCLVRNPEPKASEAPATAAQEADSETALAAAETSAAPPSQEILGMDPEQLLFTTAAIGTLGLTPLLYTGTTQDVSYAEGLLLVGTSSLGILSMGVGVGVTIGGVAFLKVVQRFNDDDQDILTRIILAPVYVLGSLIAIGVLGSGLALVVASPVMLGFGMDMVDDEFGKGPKNPFTLTVTNTAAAGIGLLSYLLWADVMGMNDDVSLTLALATSVVMSNLSHSLFRDVPGDAPRTTMIVTPLMTF